MADQEQHSSAPQVDRSGVQAEAALATAREAATQMYGELAVAERAIRLLIEVRSILDEPLDERVGHGPTRQRQFARLDALLADWPAPMGREGFDWGECRRQGEAWVATRIAAMEAEAGVTGPNPDLVGVSEVCAALRVEADEATSGWHAAATFIERWARERDA